MLASSASPFSFTPARLAVGSGDARDRTARVTTSRSRSEGASSALLDAAMDRYARGEDAAFEALYDGLAPRLLAFLARHTRDRARAEDVVQQTMLQIHRHRGRFEPGGQVVPWAFAIARRALVDAHRRGGREVLAPTDDDSLTRLLAAVDAPADDLAIAKEVAAKVNEELARLPENQRVAFELIKQDGLSVAEAAQALGTTVAAVKLRAHRAYEALREALGALGIDTNTRGDRPPGGQRG
ncbi:MAG: polymerase sigma-70 factor, subfamily [Labilithrix sp.]|nr:polymerase sigma-70 factor, subfamily [Labilithrix sp.]